MSARLIIQTITSAKITTSIMIYAQGRTEPKANGVNRIRNKRPVMKRRSKVAKGIALKAKIMPEVSSKELSGKGEERSFANFTLGA
jgi:hypothetical protein